MIHPYVSDMAKTLNKENTTKYVHSYGLIVRCNGEYLIVQNRDTEAFIYFFYANIAKWTRNHCQRVFRNFSYDEKQRLLFYPFHEIYTDLYVNFNEQTHRRQYDIAKRNYDHFKSQDWMVELLVLTHTTDTPFLFPKGRIEKDETPIQCAVREFWEETRLDISPYIQNINPGRFIKYEQYRPFYRFVSVNYLYVIDIPNRLPIQYTYFQDRIRPFSVSNEIMYATWVPSNLLRHHLPKDIYSALSPILMA